MAYPQKRFLGRLVLVAFFGLFIRSISYGQTRQLLQKLDSLFKTKADSIRDVQIFDAIDEAYTFYGMGTCEKVIPFAQRMLREAYRSKNLYRIARAQQGLSYLYSIAKDHASSFRLALAAEKEWKKRGLIKEMAEIRFHKAYLTMKNGDEKDIIPECMAVLDTCSKYKLDKVYSNISSYLGGFYMQNGQLDSAEKFLRKGLLPQGISLQRKACNALDLSNVFYGQKKYEEARKILLDIYPNIEAKELNFLLFPVFGTLSLIEYDLKNYPEALEWVDKAEEKISVETRLVSLVTHFYNKAQLLQAMKRYPESLEALWETLKFTDSLYAEDNQKNYRELEKKYQTQLKDKALKQKQQELEIESGKKKALGYLLGGILILSIAGGGIFWVNKKRKESKLLQAQAESELKALRAQMNPHFMFNSLNAIQQMILAGENKEAFQYLDKYSKLTRQILENSEKKWISIKEEIRFLELYLDMEMLRFDHSFSWKIEVDESISTHSDQIPTMLIQPLVENALKHGLLPKEGEKKLWIRFQRKDEDSPIRVEVEDNGVGRQASAEAKMSGSHQSMSLGITENRLQWLGEGKNKNLQVEDLKGENGQAVGTKVWFELG